MAGQELGALTLIHTAMRLTKGLWKALIIGVTLVECLLSQAHADTPDPRRWSDVIRAFENDDLAWRPAASSIVFTGSSSIVFWRTLHDDMAPLRVINRGFGGSTMQDAVYWVVPLVLKHKPKAVVLYEGDNDIGMYNSTPEKVRDGFVEFVSKVQAELPETTVYFLAIKPSIARWHLWSRMREANDLIRTVCEKGRNLHYIDIATPMLNERGEARAELFVADKLHMNEGGYALWTGIVKPALAEGVVNTK